MNLAPTAKYVLAMPSGQIIDQIDGGIVTYMRKVWFTLDRRTAESEGNAQWLSTQDYVDIFVYKNRDAWFETYGTGDFPPWTANWLKKNHTGKQSQKFHVVRIGAPSPTPHSYIHSKFSIGLLPIDGLRWAVYPAEPDTPFPILPYGPFIHMSADIAFNLIPMLHPISGGSISMSGEWRHDTSTLIGMAIFGGTADPTMFIPAGNKFNVEQEVNADFITACNAQGGFQQIVLFVPNDPFCEINSVSFSWRY